MLAYTAVAGVIFEVGIELLLVLKFAELFSARGIDVPFGVVVCTATGDDQSAPADPGWVRREDDAWVWCVWCERFWWGGGGK